MILVCTNFPTTIHAFEYNLRKISHQTKVPFVETTPKPVILANYKGRCARRTLIANILKLKSLTL
jgi:hypothetical protein